MASDCTTLPSLSLDVIVDNVLARYVGSRDRGSHSSIYTWVGSLLLAMNPLVLRPALYTDEVKEQFFLKKLDPTNPHVFAVAQHLLSCVAIPEKDRASNLIATAILSGESGSGKTETARFLTQYLTWASLRSRKGSRDSKSKERQIEIKLSEGAYVLEALGNAQTLNNINSSRFGKLTKINFRCAAPGYSCITSASLHTYLLAKGRIAHHPQSEQNFHIFYTFITSPEASIRGIDPKRSWRLIDGICADDVRPYCPYEALTRAMDICGLTSEVQAKIWDTAADLFHLAEIQFQDGGHDGAKLTLECSPHVDQVCASWGVDRKAFEYVLNRVKVLDQHRPFTVVEAEKTRDAIMQHVYSELFAYVVNLLNANLSHGNLPMKEDASIQILDIYGFESEPENRLEQLCINYVNEKLQGVFLSKLLLEEVKQYKREGVRATLSTTDQTGLEYDLTSALAEASEELGAGVAIRIAQLDAIFNLVHDASFGPIQEDKRDAHLVRSIHSSYPLTAPKFKSSREFIFQHFADTLTYVTEGFCEANRDDLNSDVRALLEKAQIRRVILEEPEDSRPRKATKCVKSIGLQFMSWMKSLSSLLEASDATLFVKCLRPSPSFSDRGVNRAHVCRQLRHGGIDQIVRVVKYGFPVRKPLKDLQALFLPHVKFEAEPHNFVETAMAYLHVSPTEYQIGVTTVFFRSKGWELMTQALESTEAHWDEERFAAVYKERVVKGRFRRVVWVFRFASRLHRTWRHRKAATTIQRYVRGFLERCRYKRRLRAIIRIQRMWRKHRLFVALRLLAEEQRRATPTTVAGSPGADNSVEFSPDVVPLGASSDASSPSSPGGSVVDYEEDEVFALPSNSVRCGSFEAPDGDGPDNTSQLLLEGGASASEKSESQRQSASHADLRTVKASRPRYKQKKAFERGVMVGIARLKKGLHKRAKSKAMRAEDNGSSVYSSMPYDETYHYYTNLMACDWYAQPDLYCWPPAGPAFVSPINHPGIPSTQLPRLSDSNTPQHMNTTMQWCDFPLHSPQITHTTPKRGRDPRPAYPPPKRV